MRGIILTRQRTIYSLLKRDSPLCALIPFAKQVKRRDSKTFLCCISAHLMNQSLLNAVSVATRLQALRSGV
jgi:hypothetical protein